MTGKDRSSEEQTKGRGPGGLPQPCPTLHGSACRALGVHEHGARRTADDSTMLTCRVYVRNGLQRVRWQPYMSRYTYM
jgi:hypothetical protein